MCWLDFLRKENRQKRKSNSSCVISNFVEIWNSKMVTTISLVEQAVDIAMELANLARLRHKVEAHIESSISCRFYQYQLCQGQNILVSPGVHGFEFLDLLEKMLA